MSERPQRGRFLPLRSEDILSPLLAVVPLLVFLTLACRDLSLAGLYDDEALYGAGALNVANALRSGNLASAPSGVAAYHGIVQCWMAVPFVAWGHPPGVLALRACFVVYVAAAVFLLQRLVLRALKSETAALLAALLLAASPTVVEGVHFGAYFSMTTVFFSTSALWALWRWLEDGGDIFFGLAALFASLSVSSISHALVFLAAFIVCMLYCLIFERHRRRGRTLLFGGCFLLIGLAPLIWHLWRGAPYLLEAISNRMGGSESPPWRLRDFLVMIQRLRGLLAGTGFLSPIAERPLVPAWFGISLGNPIFPLIFCGSVAVLAYAGFRPPRGGDAKSRMCALARVLVVLNLCYWLFGSMEVRFTNYYHFTNWLPIPQLTVVTALHWIVVRFGRRSMAAAAVALLLASSAVADGFVLHSFFVYLRATHGENRFSPAIYELSDWLKSEGVDHAVALTWGFSNNLPYLSGMNFVTIYGFDSKSDNVSGSYRLEQDIDAAAPIYLLRYRNPGFNIGEYRPERTLGFLRSVNYECAERKKFFGARGEPVLSVLRCAHHAVDSETMIHFVR